MLEVGFKWVTRNEIALHFEHSTKTIIRICPLTLLKSWLEQQRTGKQSPECLYEYL